MGQQQKKDYIQTVTDFSQVDLLKKVIQILIPISVFSLLLSQPLLLTSILEYFDNCVSNPIPIKIFSYSSERNYIFLLFNGILALIIKNSGLISEPQLSSSLKEREKPKINQEPKLADTDQSSEKKEIIKENVTEVEEHDATINAEDEKHESEELYEMISAEEEEEEEETGLLSTEELNKKCDDFIKKMRERIKTEIHQRIMV